MGEPCSQAVLPSLLQQQGTTCTQTPMVASSTGKMSIAKGKYKYLDFFKKNKEEASVFFPCGIKVWEVLRDLLPPPILACCWLDLPFACGEASPQDDLSY